MSDAAPAADRAHAAAAAPRASGRSRRPPEEYTVEVPVHKEFTVVPGKGRRLGDMPKVVAQLEKHKARDAVLQLLYQAAFGRRGAQAKLKAHLRDFSGYAEDGAADRAARSLGKQTMADIKAVAGIVGVERSGRKDEVVDRVVRFLDRPGGDAKAPRKRPAKDAKAPTGGAKGEPKGSAATPSKALGLYIKAKLPALKEKNAGVSEAELTKHLRTKWEGLAPEKRRKYEEVRMPSGRPRGVVRRGLMRRPLGNA